METIYAHVDYKKPVDPTPSTNQTGPRSSERRLHGAVVLCLGLLSVVLLVGLIILGVTYRDLAAEHSTIKANLTERLQASNDKLSSVSEERDLLKANLTSVSKELDTLQCLSKQKRTCPAGWKMFSCTCYLFSTKTDSWENGKKDCRDRGAELVIIDTVEKQEFIFKTLKEDNWIGLNDREKEGTWKWIDGTPLTVGYWRTGEPNNNGPGGEEDCVQIKSGVNAKESWNDVHCDNSLPWICAKKPQYLHEF
ncbi:C-type lectin domain family 4 member E-like isoform X2 [Sparus aurata]|uniref:C-type lectin domain family 4 member E-like isoform X2 n=1 Tax=Sparus aurata TaxID=8175 RepID=UPI0011C10FAE|nr:C-type lectin domain family 4 member E-like isoform X2 [Sparus aurata]